MPTKYSEPAFLNLIYYNKGELYQQPFINFKGITTDTKKRYTEILAKDLYDNKIKIAPSSINYSSEKVTKGPLHSVNKIKYSKNNVRNEENIAKRMFELECSTSYYSEGYKIVDYQVPVNRINHSTDGKIDLIMLSTYLVIICELKDNKSNESLLRAILEVQTYYQKVSRKKLQDCYNKDSVGKAIILFENTRPFNEYNNPEFNYVNKLLSKWDITVFLAESDKPLNSSIPQYNRFVINRV